MAKDGDSILAQKGHKVFNNHTMGNSGGLEKATEAVWCDCGSNGGGAREYKG